MLYLIRISLKIVANGLIDNNPACIGSDNGLLQQFIHEYMRH